MWLKDTLFLLQIDHLFSCAENQFGSTFMLILLTF